MKSYALVSLSNIPAPIATKILNIDPSENENIEEFLKQFYVVLKIQPSWHTQTTSQQDVYMMKAHNEIIMFSIEQQKFGISTFRIESTLTPDAESDEIEAELKKFEAIFYKERSKYMYQQLKGINVTHYPEPFGNTE